MVLSLDMLLKYEGETGLVKGAFYLNISSDINKVMEFQGRIDRLMRTDIQPKKWYHNYSELISTECTARTLKKDGGFRGIDSFVGQVFLGASLHDLDLIASLSISKAFYMNLESTVVRAL